MNCRKKEYKNFDEFYIEGCRCADYINISSALFGAAEQTAYARKIFSDEILNSYFIIANLPKNIMQLLNTKNRLLLFSMDNLIKNIFSHREVTKHDYLKIPFIIKNPSKYYAAESGYDVLLFKEDDKCYKLVIKTTHNRKENYVKSLHLLNKERYEKY